LGREEIEQFQLHLIRNRKVSWETYIQAMAALRFLYVKTLGMTFMADQIPYPKRPKLLPTVLSQEEISRLLDGTRSLKHRALWWRWFLAAPNSLAMDFYGFDQPTRDILRQRWRNCEPRARSRRAKN
jgi:integrase